MTKEKSEKALSQKERDQDKEDDDHDRELMDILQSSKLIEQIQSSELHGRERLKYQERKLEELGAKTTPGGRAPLPIRLGMKRKAQERLQKAIQEAKNMGMYTSKTKNDILGIDSSKKKEMFKSKKRNKDVGLFGSIGHIKDGVMTVARSHIAAINNNRSRKPVTVSRSKKRK